METVPDHAEIGPSGREGGVGYEAPRGDIERAIARVWEEVFHLDGIGRNDNFFEIGGDSLIGMKLTEAFAAHLGLQLPVVAIFQNPTIRELSQLLTVTPES